MLTTIISTTTQAFWVVDGVENEDDRWILYNNWDGQTPTNEDWKKAWGIGFGYKSPTDLIPTASTQVETTPTEKDVSHLNYFMLKINKAINQDASVNYTTVDGTAIAGEDYVATSGIAIIPAGKTSTLIGVVIIGDSFSENNENFYLSISQPKGGIFQQNKTVIMAQKTIMNDD